MTAPTLTATYLHDGTVFDLGIQHVDVLGVVWHWTGNWTAAGEPLMASDRAAYSVPDDVLVPLPDVYRDHGPLIPLHGQPRIDRDAWMRGAA